jgi:purine-binding chemotaxis protein CheW
MSELLLLLRVASEMCVFPMHTVIEVMRPLPIQPMGDVPPFVLGLARVRGAPVPVVCLARLLGHPSPAVYGRFLTVRVGAGLAVLAVDAVLGVNQAATAGHASLPPILRGALPEVVAGLAALDSAFLLFLDTGRILPSTLAFPEAHAG